MQDAGNIAIIEKQKALISSLGQSVQDMKEVIAGQQQEIGLLQELDRQLDEKNRILEGHNREVMDTVRRFMEDLGSWPCRRTFHEDKF